MLACLLVSLELGIESEALPIRCRRSTTELQPRLCLKHVVWSSLKLTL